MDNSAINAAAEECKKILAKVGFLSYVRREAAYGMAPDLRTRREDQLVHCRTILWVRITSIESSREPKVDVVLFFNRPGSEDTQVFTSSLASDTVQTKTGVDINKIFEKIVVLHKANFLIPWQDKDGNITPIHTIGQLWLWVMECENKMLIQAINSIDWQHQQGPFAFMQHMGYQN